MPNLIPFFQKHFPRFFPQIQKTTALYDRVKSLRPVSVRPDTLTPSLGLAYFLEANVSIFADIVLTLKQEVTRRGMVWKPRFAVKCMDCGSEYIEEKPVCDCGSANLKQPDRTQIQRFRDADGKSFLESANLNRQTLESVMEEATRHGTIGDRIYLLCIKNYLQDEVGNILASYPVEFISIDPRDIEPIEQDDGTPGGKYWICLDHRDDVKEKPGVCRQCGKVLYEVLYQTTGLSQKIQYYIDGEIYFTPVHYPRKGYPPILKMLYDAYAYHYMEMRTYNYQKKGRPPGFLVFPTNNLESLKAQWEALLIKAQEDPDSPQAMGFDPGQGKAAAQFITLMKDPGPDMLEVKKDLRERMGSMFGVSLIFQGDTSSSGGLNNEGLQITVTNRATEFYQKPLNGREQNNYKDGILYWVVQQFGITDFVLQLLPSEEQDEMAEKQRFGLDADNAKKMLDMGYDVKFENGKFTFSGQAQKPQPLGFGGGMPGLAGMPAPTPEPRVSGTPADVGKAGDIKKDSGCCQKSDVDEFDELNKDELVKAYSSNVYQAIKQGALYYFYDGVSEQDVETIHGVIKQAFADKRLSLREMVKEITEQTAVTEQQAEVIARTESSAVANSAREIGWKKMERERGERFLYKWSVAHDHRTSDICLEIESRVGAGVPLEELKRIVREVSQEYIPGWNGWEQLVAHPNERSTPLRIII